MDSKQEIFNIKNTCEFLGISYRFLKKLINEGYLKNVSDNPNLIIFDKNDIDNVKDKIPEIKKFWEYKSTLNRKINIQNINRNKKNYFHDPFKTFLDKKCSSLNYLDSLLVRNTIFLIYIRNHLENKKRKNIIDKSLNKIYVKSLNKIFELVKQIDNVKIEYYKGDDYIIYCDSCKSQNNIQKCSKCVIDIHYNSKLIISFKINTFDICFYCDYKDLKNISDITYSRSSKYKDRIIIDLIEIKNYYLETLKLGDVITELKNFGNYKI